MFSDHKKLSIDFTMVPTIADVSSGKLSPEALDALQEVSDVFKKISSSLDVEIKTSKGVPVAKNELVLAQEFINRAQGYVSNIMIGEYNTLSNMVTDTKLANKLEIGFMGITGRAVKVAGDIADFVTEAVEDFLDGVNNSDDKLDFMDSLVTKLYIAIAKAVTRISDVCYDAERLAVKMLSGLS